MIESRNRQKWIEWNKANAEFDEQYKHCEKIAENIQENENIGDYLKQAANFWV